MNWRLFLVSAVAAFLVAIVAVKVVGSNSKVASETIVLSAPISERTVRPLQRNGEYALPSQQRLAPPDRGPQSAPTPDSVEGAKTVIDAIVNVLGIPLDHIDVRVVGVAAMIGFALGFVGDLVRSLFEGEFSVNLALGTAVGMASSVAFQSTLIG